MPRVSVIVPAHNAAASIAATLRSVQAQTFSDWEVVVADDASADGTADAVRALGDERIRVVRTERNLGPAGARNLAAREIGGELVALLDADDAWLPEYLERQVAAWKPDIGIVACDAHFVQDGERLPRTFLERVEVGEPSLERLLRGNFIYVSALFPREAAETAGWFDEGLFGTEDHDLWLRIAETGRRIVINREPLALYTFGEGSVASNLGRMGRNVQLLYERALARGNLTPAQQRIARQQLRYHAAMEAVATRAGLVRRAPLLARVVAENPRRWGDWWRALRAGGRVS